MLFWTVERGWRILVKSLKEKFFVWLLPIWERIRPSPEDLFLESRRLEKRLLCWLVRVYSRSFRQDDEVTFWPRIERKFKTRPKEPTLQQIFGANPYLVMRVIALSTKPYCHLQLASRRKGLLRHGYGNHLNLEPPREFSSLLFRHANWKVGVWRLIQTLWGGCWSISAASFLFSNFDYSTFMLSLKVGIMSNIGC